MELICEIAEWTASIIDALVMVILLKELFGKKEKKLSFLAAMLYAMLTVLTSMYISNVFLQTLLIVSYTLAYEILYLKGNLLPKLVFPIGMTAMIGIVNVIVVYLFSFTSKVSIYKLVEPGTISRIISLSLDKLIIIFLATAILRKIRHNIFGRIEWFIMLSTFSASVVLCLIILNVSVYGRLDVKYEKELLLIPVGLIVINAASSVSIFRISRQYMYKMENKLLNVRLKEEKNMLVRMNEVYEESRRQRHDMKHYFLAIYGLLENDEQEEAMKQIQEIIGCRLSKHLISYLGSSVLNAILNEKLSECDKRGIKLDVTISGNIPMNKEMEIGVILSNLLDNAIEAEESVEPGEIAVDIHEMKGMSYLTVKNKINESVLAKNPRLITSKTNKERHGIGLLSIEKLVENIDGSYQRFEENGFFVSYVTAPFDTE